jgi:hypothetical protein
LDESQEPREGQDLTLAQALQRPDDVEKPERIEHKLDAAERPYERVDEPGPHAKPLEKDR